MRKVRAKEVDVRIVDGVELHGQYLAAQVEDGTIFIGTPADFMVASIEILSKVRLVKRTLLPLRDWPINHLRLPSVTANA